MARGQSGRIVIEVDPAMKLALYAALARSNSTLKDWFVEAAVHFCESEGQQDLFAHLPVAKVGSAGTKQLEQLQYETHSGSE